MILNEIANSEIAYFPMETITAYWKKLKFANPGSLPE